MNELCRMFKLVVRMLEHTEKRKKEYWGKDERIYKFYEGQNVCCRDLLLQYQEEQARVDKKEEVKCS